MRARGHPRPTARLAPAPAPAGGGGRRGRAGWRGRGAGDPRAAPKKIVSFRSGGDGRHFPGAARGLAAAPSGVRRSEAAEEAG